MVHRKVTNHLAFAYDSLKTYKSINKDICVHTRAETRQGEHARIWPLHRLVGSDLS